MKEVKKQKKYKILLSQSFLFDGVDPALAETAFDSGGCTCAEFGPGEKIYTRTHFSKSLGIVLSGNLIACKPGLGGEKLVMNTFYTGGIFGVACLFNSTKHYVSEVTAVKRSRLMFLSQELLRSLFEQNSRVAENYISYLSNRICFLNSRIDNFTGGNAENRLTSFLQSLAKESTNPLRFTLPCTLTQLAGMLGIGRASLYRAMDALEESNVIRRTGKKIEVSDPDWLKSGLF